MGCETIPRLNARVASEVTEAASVRIGLSSSVVYFGQRVPVPPRRVPLERGWDRVAARPHFPCSRQAAENEILEGLSGECRAKVYRRIHSRRFRIRIWWKLWRER